MKAIRQLQTALATWFQAVRRSLPWRDVPTPYRVWVSEVMLQQTQVQTVIPYFERFMEAFPTIGTLADASDDEVMQRWAGLGYYRRARMLHAAAKTLAAEGREELPRSVAGLQALPGIGRYSAGAIASIAYGIPAPVLDGNVARVLARMLALELEADGTEGLRVLWAEATALVPKEDPSTHNQALMELGALVCTPTNPKCELCPWHAWCAARAAGAMEAYPKKRPKRAPLAVRAVSGLVTRGAGDGAVLLARRPAGGLLGGLWEVPGIELGDADEAPEGALEGAFRARLGMAVEAGAHLATVTHQFTHRTLTLELFRAHRLKREVPALAWYTDWRWVARERADEDVPLSTLAKKVLAASRGVA